MADFFRVQLGVVSRAEGHSAAKRSAYQSCGVVVDHENRRFDFTRKAAEHVRTIMLTPHGAPDWTREPQSLWQRAAAVEKRGDAQEARIIDLSMPRAVPAELWEACVRHVYSPLIEMGMVVQVDIHDSPARDGGRNINVHGLGSLRGIEGDGFAKRKNRGWNDRFRERQGRMIRELFAERLTSFCQEHGLDYKADARANSERGLPDPEPTLPKWNFEKFKRAGELTDALVALQDHRAKRGAWEAAKAEEIEAALDLAKVEHRIRERRERRLSSAEPTTKQPQQRDRRAAILRAWHAGGWIDAERVAAIAATRFDPVRSCLWIDLKDGSTLIDQGDFIRLRGRLTWTAAVETAAAAERHGWTAVCIFGDQAYKDAVAMACLLRGIEVANHVLSPKAQAKFKALLADHAKRSTNSDESESRVTESLDRGQQPRGSPPNPLSSSREIHLEITKRHSVSAPSSEDAPDTTNAVPTFKPRFPKPPAKRGERGRSAH